MSASPVPRPRRGVRASSRLTIVVTAAHDGDRSVLAEHVGVEVGAVLDRWGVEVLDVDTSSEAITAGDDLSPFLPTIGPLPDEDVAP